MTTATHEKTLNSFWIDAFDTAHVAVNVSGDTTFTEARETALARMTSELWDRGASADWAPAVNREPHVTDLGHDRFLVEWTETYSGRVL